MNNQFKPNKNKNIWIAVLISVIILIVIAIYITNPISKPTPKKPEDIRRISNLQQIVIALGLYYDEYKIYPDNLDDLASKIEDLPVDSSVYEDYYYIPIDSGSGYHLGAELDDSGHKALESDSDFDSSEINGFNGKDPIYDVYKHY